MNDDSIDRLFDRDRSTFRSRSIDFSIAIDLVEVERGISVGGTRRRSTRDGSATRDDDDGCDAYEGVRVIRDSHHDDDDDDDDDDDVDDDVDVDGASWDTEDDDDVEDDDEARTRRIRGERACRRLDDDEGCKGGRTRGHGARGWSHGGGVVGPRRGAHDARGDARGTTERRGDGGEIASPRAGECGVC